MNKMLIKRNSLTIIILSMALFGLAGCNNFLQKGESAKTRVILPKVLIQAAKANNFSKVEDLLKNDANVNAVSPEGTALMMAVKANNARLVLLLLQHGANPDFGIPKGGDSAIMVAADKGNLRIVQLLLASDADVNYTNKNGDAAVSMAIYKGHFTMVKALIRAGADVNIDPGGSSLLMHTVSNNDLLLSQALIAAGADVNFTSASSGMTSLKIAIQKHFSDLQMLLIQSGAH